jgi:hypothetical protein
LVSGLMPTKRRLLMITIRYLNSHSLFYFGKHIRSSVSRYHLGVMLIDRI